MNAKPQLVLLHGWASHTGVFRSLTRALEKKFRVTALPLPGYGGVPACEPYTPDRMAAQLAASLGQSVANHCHVLGWSLGAQVALAWARRAPAQVSRLALVAATPCFVQREGWPYGATPALMRQFTAQLKRDGTALLRRFVALQAQGDANAVRVTHQLRTALFTHAAPAPAVLEAGLEILRTADLRGGLGGVLQSALVIHGEADAVTPCAAGEALSRLLPNARFEKIPGAGHAPFLCRADACAAMLTEFFHESAARA